MCRHKIKNVLHSNYATDALPPVIAECRHAMATLALGSKVLPLSFYHSLSKITHPAVKLNI